MFGMFKKNKKEKSELEKLIDRDGIEYATQACAKIILEKLPTAEIAYQFVLEEIEAASQGSGAAIKFTLESGIRPNEYKGAMGNSRPEVDGLGGPQQLLLGLCMELQPDMDLVVKFRTMVVDSIMQHYSFGKYKPQTKNINHTNTIDKKNKTLAEIVGKKHQTGYVFGNIMNDLGSSVESIMEHSKQIQMAYAYARRSAAIALYLQGVIDIDAYDHNLAFFKAMQQNTGHTVEFQEQAFTDAVVYMQTYNPAITRLLIQYMASVAPTCTPPKVIFSDSELIEMFVNIYTQQ